MPDNQPVLSAELALSYIRGFSGMEHYPFHLEGEKRLAAVLIQFAPAVGHARAVVEEFDGDTCPSVEALRAMCIRMAEKCKCGRALWQHRDLADCKWFRAIDPDEIPDLEKSRADAQASAALGSSRDWVPLIPGVRWDVCLKMQCILLAATGKLINDEYARDYPEAFAGARRGAAIDPQYVEQRMRALHPHMFLTFADKNLKVLRSAAEIIQ